MKNKITLWYRYNKKKEKEFFTFNHLENDWCLNSYPTPHCIEQKKPWMNGIWLKKFGYLKNGIVEELI